MLFPLAEGAKGLEKAVNKLCLMAEDAVNKGHNYLILTDRGVNAEMVAIPSLLAVSAVHHHLIECRKRMQIDIVVESAEPREIMHFALLLGYGASVINPYGAFAVLNDLVKKKEIQSDYETAESHYIKSVNKGLLKVLSKMGISTVRSYRGAQIFEAVGISSAVLSRYFDGTTSKIEGITLEDIATDAIIMHQKGFGSSEPDILVNNGVYSCRQLLRPEFPSFFSGHGIELVDHCLIFSTVGWEMSLFISFCFFDGIQNEHFTWFIYNQDCNGQLLELIFRGKLQQRT